MRKRQLRKTAGKGDTHQPQARGPSEDLAFAWRAEDSCAAELSDASTEMARSDSSDSSSDGEDAQWYLGLSPPPLWEGEVVHALWASALGSRHPYALSLEELRVLAAAGGIPLKHRLVLWPRWFTERDALDVETLQRKVPEAVRAQIELDVPRTQPRWLGDADRAALRRVLSACAVQRPELGYCQGMNNIAAVLIILGFDECTALQGLLSLLRSCCPGYHDVGLAGWLRDAAVLGSLARDALPQEALRRLDSLDIPLEVLASEHFLTVASRSWPLAATTRLWDLILLEGPAVLLASFLALLQLYLPGEEELRAAAVVGGREAPEPVEVFRQAVLRGVTEDLPTVLRHTRELMQLMPQGKIDVARRASFR